MLIWLGVVGTVLTLVCCGILFQMYGASEMMHEYTGAVLAAAERIEKSCHEHLTAIESASRMFTKQVRDENERSTEKLKEIHVEHANLMAALFNGIQVESKVQSERELEGWKQATGAFTKSEQELADNLALLLREIKVSKQLAAGSIALVEQNVMAIDRLLKLVELLRSGPRVATNIAPSEADQAANEAGFTDEQQRAMEMMLAGARSRMNAQDDIL